MDTVEDFPHGVVDGSIMIRKGEFEDEWLKDQFWECFQKNGTIKVLKKISKQTKLKCLIISPQCRLVLVENDYENIMEWVKHVSCEEPHTLVVPFEPEKVMVIVVENIEHQNAVTFSYVISGSYQLFLYDEKTNIVDWEKESGLRMNFLNYSRNSQHAKMGREFLSEEKHIVFVPGEGFNLVLINTEIDPLDQSTKAKYQRESKNQKRCPTSMTHLPSGIYHIYVMTQKEGE